MNDGVKILLARMETHPEEFAYDPREGMSKWGRLLDNFRHCLTKEEINAVEVGLRNIERDRFTELVMTELLDPHENVQQEINFRTSGNVTLNASQLLQSSTITYTSDPLVNRKPITKFGRLYNHERNND